MSRAIATMTSVTVHVTIFSIGSKIHPVSNFFWS